MTMSPFRTLDEKADTRKFFRKTFAVELGKSEAKKKMKKMGAHASLLVAIRSYFYTCKLRTQFIPIF